MKIGTLEITQCGRPFFIADIAANHDGDINRAFKLIELAKEAGADVAKFQNFKAPKIVSKNAFDHMPKQTHQSAWTKSVYEVYSDASLADEWTERLKEKCNEVGIEYMTSPYDYESVDLADRYSNAFKIGSGDITWTDMLSYIAKKGKPVLLATGAADINDVKRAVSVITAINPQLILMQCNTNYTVDKENFKYINLRVLETYHRLYPDLILGLSDHTPGHTTVLGAIAMGARVFEKHFTDDNGREGPDHKFAMNPKTWKEMVDESMNLYYALGDGEKKVEDNERSSRIVQQRSVYYQKDLTAGSVITPNDIFPVRPINEQGYYPYEMDSLIGRRLKRDVLMDSPVLKGDVEDD
jgi:N-acetylneuraminate synthase